MSYDPRDTTGDYYEDFDEDLEDVFEEVETLPTEPEFDEYDEKIPSDLTVNDDLATEI